MEYKVRIHKDGEMIERSAQQDANLLEFLRKNSVTLNTPCNGKGTCGKCRVKVNGLTAEPSEREKKVIGDAALEKGYRLACYNSVKSDLDVYLDEKSEDAKIATGARERSVELFPLVKKEYFVLNQPSIEDQISDIDRVADCIEGHDASESVEMVRSLPEVLRANDYKVTLGYMEDKLIFVEPGDTTQNVFGIAVDIGTTTVAAYLLDLKTGKKMDIYSALNPQKRFGADVLSRIDYTLRSQESQDEMNALIISCINEAVQFFTSRNNIKNTDIYTIVLVGNTTMMHFLMKLSAKNIATAPFIPVTTRLHRFKANEMGININPHAYAVMFPAVSAYIGADTVAAVLSSGMYADDKISLLIDIGTNGEIVLGNNKWLYSCSTAAGPAFEGANIRNGVGGIKGAIDKISFDSDVKFTTIGNAKAIGICGSGIVDTIAGMLSAGIIDETGRIFTEDDDEYEKLPVDLQKRLVDIGGLNALLLLRNEECAADMDIAITQRDVRELQNAKAAIAAGIKVLVMSAGIDMKDIDRVYLAGGFGSYINIESALKIGLLPAELKGKVESIGNAAGAGAVEGLISEKMLETANEIKRRIKYIELSARPEFVDEYVECMMFE